MTPTEVFASLYALPKTVHNWREGLRARAEAARQARRAATLAAAIKKHLEATPTPDRRVADRRTDPFLRAKSRRELRALTNGEEE